jgi:hypothetical protein
LVTIDAEEPIIVPDISEYLSVYKDLEGMTIVGSGPIGAKVYFGLLVTTVGLDGTFALTVPEVTGEFTVELIDEKSIKFLRGLADSTQLHGNYSGKKIYVQPQTDDEMLIAIQDVGYRRIEI